MEVTDVLGHVFYALLVVGNWLIGNKKIWGFAFYFVANLGWLWIGWEIGMTSIWFWEIIFVALAARNFWKWRQDAQS